MTGRFMSCWRWRYSSAFFYALGTAPLFDVDEGAFSQATREMFLRGDFLSTTLNGQPRYDKPILSYWLQAASIATFGVNEWAFRLPSALAATLWAMLIFGFVRRIADARRALLAALLMTTSLSVTIIGKAATADALLNLWLAASLLSLYLYLHEGWRSWLYLAAAAMGLGVLTKGPVAVVIPAGVSLLYCASRGEWRIWLRLLSDGRAWALFALIALPWYVVQYLRDGDGFLSGFLLRHNLDRFQQPLEGHGGGWWYYLPVLLAGMLPYTTVLSGFWPKAAPAFPNLWAV
ncbi:MAG: phospholipid carrier-dependent glycosyltransferase, partial [Synechococcaceae cyanobacterium SM1_2_3]|nr:phospholipid carrier-dependent glycosyltransferase [Synechococcaceae cyanobacterium SM1_2_3]